MSMPAERKNWVVVLPFEGEPLVAVGTEPQFVLLEHLSPDCLREANYWSVGMMAPASSERILARGFINHLNRICFEECAANRNTVYDIVQNYLKSQKKTAKRSIFFDVENILSLFITRAMNEHIPDEQDLYEVKKYTKNIANCSPEEIRDCLNVIMEAENPAAGIRLAQEAKALQFMLPEVTDAKGFWQKYKKTSSELYEHLMVTLDFVAKHTDGKKKRNLRWAALLHDIGKLKAVWVDKKGLTHFHKGPEGQGENHEEVGPVMINEMLSRIEMPQKDIDEICSFVEEHMFDHFDNKKGAKEFVEMMRGEERALDMLILRGGDVQNKPKQKEAEKEIKEMQKLIKRVCSDDEEWEEVSLNDPIIIVFKEYDII